MQQAFDMSFQIQKVTDDEYSFYRALARIMDFTTKDEQQYLSIRTLILDLLVNTIEGNLLSNYETVYLNDLLLIIQSNQMMPPDLISIVGALIGASICVIQPGSNELVLTLGDNDPLTRARLNNINKMKGKKLFPCDLHVYYNGGEETTGR